MEKLTCYVIYASEKIEKLSHFYNAPLTLILFLFLQ